LSREQCLGEVLGEVGDGAEGEGGGVEGDEVGFGVAGVPF